MRPINDFLQAAAQRGERIKRTTNGYQILDANGNVIDGDEWPLDIEDLCSRYSHEIMNSFAVEE